MQPKTMTIYYCNINITLTIKTFIKMITFVNKIASVVVLLLIATSSYAQQQTTVIMNNGSSICGDIIVQRPGKDLTISSTKALLVIKDTEIKSRKDKNIRYENLAREWKRWVLENKALKGDADGRYLAMSDIVTSNYIYNNIVKVKTSSTNGNTYIQAVPTTFTVEWKDISEIRRTTLPANITEGVDDEVTTIKGKTYRGTIVSQKIGQTLTIKTNSSTTSLSMNNIREICKIPRTLSQSLFAQADFINTLVLNDGTLKDGIITVQHYGTKGNDQYIILTHKNGTKEKIAAADIAEYRTSYTRRKEESYAPGKVYVNEFAIKKAKTLTENGMTAYVDKSVYPFPEGIVTTFKASGDKFQSKWYLIALDKVELENGIQTQGYTEKTKATNSITPSTTDISKNISSISFIYLSPGFYALVNDNSNETYIIKIIK